MTREKLEKKEVRPQETSEPDEIESEKDLIEEISSTKEAAKCCP